MIAPPWDIRHVDLRDGAKLAPSARPLLAVFWWGALPLGMRTYLPEQLPLHGAQIVALTAQFAAIQLAARSRQFGGPAAATFDGRPVLTIPIDSVRQSEDVLRQLDDLAVAELVPAHDLSIIVCTRDRPGMLARCLQSLAEQDSPPREIIVVDNSAGRTAETVAAGLQGVRYVHEPRPGLSVARNTGIGASRGTLIAFTDDDAEPRPTWTSEIARAFANPDIDAVTGLVLPAKLETPAQCFFQFGMGGFGTTCVPTVFDRRFFDQTRAMGAQVWRIGAGANMAFRRAVFERIGLFDERLGAGASGCSEDSELWYRLLAANGACMFEPRAWVIHHHREQWIELRRQMKAYMKGHVSALFVQATRFGHAGNLRRIFLQLPGYFARTAFRALRDGGGAARFQILGDEIVGWFCGLHYGLRPRWRRSNAVVTMGAIDPSPSESRP